jgi:hypothetical protein
LNKIIPSLVKIVQIWASTMSPVEYKTKRSEQCCLSCVALAENDIDSFLKIDLEILKTAVVLRVYLSDVHTSPH